MSFLFGCLAIMVVAASLIASTEHQKGNDICIIHWVLGFCAASLFYILLILGIWW